MIVTPIDAISPIVGDSRDVYFRSTRSTVWAAAAWSRHRWNAGLRGCARGGQRAETARVRRPPGGDHQRRAVGRRGAVSADRARARPWPGGGRRDRRVLLRVRVDVGRSRSRLEVCPRRCQRTRRQPVPAGVVGAASRIVAVGGRRAEARRSGRPRRRRVRRVVRGRAWTRRAADHGHAGRPGRSALGGIAAQRRVRAHRVRPARRCREWRQFAGSVPRSPNSPLPCPAATAGSATCSPRRPRSSPCSPCSSRSGGHGSR